MKRHWLNDLMECLGTVAFSKLPTTTRGIAIIKNLASVVWMLCYWSMRKEGRWESVFMWCCTDIKDADHTMYIDEGMGERKRDGRDWRREGMRERWRDGEDRETEMTQRHRKRQRINFSKGWVPLGREISAMGALCCKFSHNVKINK